MQNRILSITLIIASSLCAYPPAGTFHDIDVDFQATFSAIAAIELNTTATTDLSAIFTVLEANQLCIPIASGPINISTPGTYCLTEDIVGTVTLSASNITLDLNGHTISGGTPAVEVVATVSAVTIRNGIIADPDTGGTGLLVGLGVQSSTFDNLIFINSGATGGTAFDSFMEGSRILNCVVNGQWDSGIRVEGQGNDAPILIDNCIIAQLGRSGEALAEGLYVSDLPGSVITNCLISNLSNATTIRGMNITGSAGSFTGNIVISNCSVTEIEQDSSDLRGIEISGSAQANIVNCTVSQLSGDSTTGKQGILLDSQYNIVENCKVQSFSGINGTGSQAGIRTTSEGNIIRGCSVLGLKIGNGGSSEVTMNGIYIDTASLFVTVQDCIVDDLSVAQSSGTALPFGIRISSTFGNTVDVGHVIRNNTVSNIVGSGAVTGAQGAIGIALSSAVRSCSFVGNHVNQVRASFTGTSSQYPAGMGITASSAFRHIFVDNVITNISSNIGGSSTGLLGAPAPSNGSSVMAVNNQVLFLDGGTAYRNFLAGTATSAAKFTATTALGINLDG